MRSRRIALLVGAVLLPALASAQTRGGAARPAGARPPVVMLATRVPALQFEEAPLRDVLDSLSQLLQINVVVRWEELQRAGVTRDKPVTVSLRNLRLDQALWVIMNEAAGPDVRLAYRADADVLLISTADDLESHMVVRVYDVQDLLFRPLEEASMQVGREREVVTGTTATVAEGAVAATPVVGRVRSGVGINGPGGFGPTSFGQGGGDPDDDDDVNQDPDVIMQQLINVITTTIEPESWDINGGRGAIRPFGGRLVVRNTYLVHQAIGGAGRE